MSLVRERCEAIRRLAVKYAPQRVVAYVGVKPTRIYVFREGSDPERALRKNDDFKRVARFSSESTSAQIYQAIDAALLEQEQRAGRLG